MTATSPQPTADRAGPLVPCPTCRRLTPYRVDNPWRPFCGERCKHIDMGAWAAEDYRMPAAPPPEDLDDLNESSAG